MDGKVVLLDSVSRDGVHKIVAVWELDIRPVNGAAFVSFAMTLLDASDPEARAAIEYGKGVLNALQITQGPAHMKIACNHLGNGRYSPCLIDIVLRCHGGDATWGIVAKECIGYTQLECVLNCIVRPDRFDELPFEPSLLAQGGEVSLICHRGGTIADIPGLDLVRDLASFRCVH